MNSFIKISQAIAISAGIAFAVTAASAAMSSDKSQSEQFAKTATVVVAIMGAGCSQHAWPNYEPKCQFDARGAFAEKRIVRVLTLR